MTNFIKSNTEYIGVDTTAGADSTTLQAIAGKDYYVVNLGTGSNLFTVNYGSSSLDLSDLDATTIFYDGSNWIVGNVVSGDAGDIRYSPTLTYTATEIVWYPDAFYVCILEGTDQQPDISPLYWEKVSYEASQVAITDTGEYFTGVEVETALQEVGAGIATLDTGKTDVTTTDALAVRVTAVEADKLDIVAPTVDAEVKTIKVNQSTDAASTRGSGTVKLDDAGTNLEVSNGTDWVPLGAGADPEGFNYDNRNFETNIDGYSTYNDGAVDEPVDGTGGTATYTSMAEDIATPLIADRSLKLSKSANDAMGEGMSYDFSIDRGQLGGTCEIKFAYETSANYAAGDMGVYLYDIDNANLMYPSVVDMPSTYENPGTYFSTFIPSDSLNYRIIWHVQSTNALSYDVDVDNIQIGKFTTAIGDSTDIYDTGWIEASAWADVGFYHTLPSGFIGMALAEFSVELSFRDAVNYPDISSRLENYSTNSTAGAIGIRFDSITGVLSLRTRSDGVYVSNPASSSPTLLSTQTWQYRIVVKKLNQNVKTLSSFTEYAYNSSIDNADNTVDYKSNGWGTIPLYTTLGIFKTVKWANPIQETDLFFIDLKTEGFPVTTLNGGLRIDGSSFVSFGYDGTDYFGIGYEHEDSYTTNVLFMEYRLLGNVSWSIVKSTKYRIRKVSNGNMAEQPPIVRAEYNNISSSASGASVKWPDKIEDTHDSYDPLTGIITCKRSGILSVNGAARTALSTIVQTLDIENITTGYSKRLCSIDLPNAANIALGFASSLRVSLGDQVQITTNFTVSANTANAYAFVLEIRDN